MAECLLSICIPVFNQGTELALTLREMESFQFLTSLLESGKVQVIVSDNASNTPIREQVGYLAPIGIDWHRQQENLGFRGNLEYLADSARGNYIWFIGAGEVVLEDHFYELVNYLDMGEFVCGTVGTKYLDVRSGEISFTQQSWLRLKRALPLLRPLYTEAIAGNIYAKEFFLKGMSKPPLTGDMWPHVEIANSGLKISDAFKVAFFPHPVVTIYGSADGWWTRTGADITFYKHISAISSKPSFLIWPSNLLKYIDLVFRQNQRVLRSVVANPKQKYSNLNASSVLRKDQFASIITRIIYWLL